MKLRESYISKQDKFVDKMEDIWEKGSQKVITKLQTTIQSQKEKKETKAKKVKKEKKEKKPKKAKKVKRDLAAELLMLRKEFHAFQAKEEEAMRERHRQLWEKKPETEQLV